MIQIKKHIPNTITCLNLISGCVAITYALIGEPQWALLWIIIGATFDFFDGLSARLLGVSSPIGKELDSLADDITFGVAPAAIVAYELSVIDYPALLEPYRGYIPYFAFIIAAFSALRLAKFNLDERQTTSFIGLPTPANALFWGSFIIGAKYQIENCEWALPALLIMVCVSSWLLVCELPMFALKFKQWGWKGNEIRYSFIALCALIFAAFIYAYGLGGILYSFWIVIVAYILISIIQWLRS